MMKVAIVGAGFAGLAAAYHLSRDCKVAIFDAKGVGGGASGVSTGLLHPYPGEQGRRSWKADEAMAAAQKLLKAAEEALGRPVASYTGILKLGECLSPGEDVEMFGPNQYLIKSGITVFSSHYLQGLFLASKAELYLKEITTLEELRDFDKIVLAVGAGIRNFPQCRHLKLGFVKGQVLTCKTQTPLERSVVAKKYRALTENPNIYHLGATYERDFTTEASCMETATQLLQPQDPVLDCHAAIRVTNPAHYFPMLEQLDSKTWVITALGSRGLLYHGFLAEQLIIS